MHSFISNFDWPKPAAPARRGWSISLLVLGSLLLAGEFLVRQVPPAPEDYTDSFLWSQSYSEATRGGRGSLVLLGTSRTLTNLNPKVLAEDPEWTSVHQLGIQGSRTFPVLESFLRDAIGPSTVICELNPPGAFSAPMPGDTEQIYLGATKPFLDGPSDWVENRLSLAVGGILSMARRPGVWKRLIMERVRGRRRDLLAGRFRAYRAEFGSPEKRSKQWQEDCKVQEPWTPAKFEQVLARLKGSIAKFRSLGGRVLFVQHPNTGKLREIIEARWPRPEYWQRLVEAEIGDCWLHFEDERALSGYQLLDESHLTIDETASFTKSLVELLRRPGCLTTR